jgi:hypothetical protein
VKQYLAHRAVAAKTSLQDNGSEKTAFLSDLNNSVTAARLPVNLTPSLISSFSFWLL